jgi:ADP-heptose:LPS heptosyltransferase
MQPQKVLILKLGAMGDIAISTTLCRRHFAENFKGYSFAWVTDAVYVPIARAFLPSDWALFEMSSKRLFRGTFFEKVQESLHIARLIRRARPDAILILHRDSRYRRLARIAAPFAKIHLLPFARGVSEYEAIRNCLEKAFPKSEPLPADIISISSREPAPAPKSIALHIGGGENPKGYFLAKTWPYWKELAERILQDTDADLHLIGSESDGIAARAWIEPLTKSRQASKRLHLLFGKGSDGIPPLLRLFSSIDALVSVDTGVAHLAAQLMKDERKNILTLFGPTSEKEWRPRSVLPPHPHLTSLLEPIACHPCYKQDGNLNPCIYTGENFQLCMKSLRVEKVFRHLFPS